MIGVYVQRYSLEAGKVGQNIGVPVYISSHKSLAAAGRVLGSLISGKRKREPTGYAAPTRGEGLRLYAFDGETGLRYSRNGCRTGEPLPAGQGDHVQPIFSKEG